MASGIIRVNGVVNGSNHVNGNGKHASESQDLKLLVLSAFDEKAVERRSRQFSSWFETGKVSSDRAKLEALAYTLAARRSHMRWRGFAVAGSDPEYSTSAKTMSVTKPMRVETEPGMAWVFTGQGAQYIDMGWDLIHSYPIFEQVMRKVDETYRDLGCDWSVFGRSLQPPGITW